tara:strand:- start:2287 stop:2463 length:177 start_codon:yes stop_codon:yes gene_type:complete
MSMTLEELKERLKQLDEIHVLDLLQLESHQLVDRYEDIIINKFSELENEIEEIDNEQD